MLKRLGWSVYLAQQVAAARRMDLRDANALRQRQERNIQRIVRHAYSTVPFYAETMQRRGLTPAAIQTAEDLAKLPIVEKSFLQKDPEYFLSRAVRRDHCLALRSSGSSGTPKSIWHDAAAIFQNAAHGERDRAAIAKKIGRWTGYRETVIVAPIDASQLAVQTFVRANALFPGRIRVQRQYLYLSDPPEQNLRAMNEFRPDLLYSYGSYVEMLYRRFSGGDVAWHFPKAILFSSDRLSPSIRLLLTKELGISVFSVYGAVEALKIGFECDEQKGYHINSDLYPVRVVDEDGMPRRMGEAGQVIVSNLVNRATVLLNYRLGDLAHWIGGPCPCGLALPLLSPPIGRIDDVIELGNGTVVHPMALREICLQHSHILQYQIRQVASTRFLVSLIAAREADLPNLESAIRAGFERRFGDGLTAEVRCVQELDRNPSGKTPTVIALQKNVSPEECEPRRM
jgi:phenylacetate-CoA ligase